MHVTKILYAESMGFWQNVRSEIEYTGISRKEISYETGIPLQTINRGIQRDSKPYVLDALKVAKVFNKDISYFLDSPIVLKTEQESDTAKKAAETQKQLELYRKYRTLIQACEKIPQGSQNAVKQLAQTLAEEEKNYKAK